MKNLRYFLPALLWAGLIVYLLCIRVPKEVATFSFPGWDKIVHAGLFGVLAWLGLWGANAAGKRAAIGGVLAASVLFGGFTEWIQWQWVPNRSGDWLDWLADSVGIGLAAWAFGRWQRLREKLFGIQ